MVPAWAHNPIYVGSSPTSATSFEVCMKVFMMLLLLMSAPAFAENGDEEFWDTTCLYPRLKECGNVKLPADPKTELTEEQRNALVCRLKALVDCRLKQEEVNP